MDNFNIDENSLNKIKDMMNKGELSDVISQIPPEMIQNFSSMMSSNNSSNNTNSNSTNSSNCSNNNYSKNSNSSKNSNNFNNNFDFSNIDANTILRVKSIIENMNNPNDPRANLLSSLKPYLRDGRKEKLDQYANLLNMAKIAEILNNNSNNNHKENRNNE